MLVTGTRLNQHGNVAALTALVTMPNGSSTRATPISRSGFISGNVITSS
jgi:hypothetical protein